MDYMLRGIPFSIVCLLAIASCTFTQKVRTGLEAYEVKQYSVAAQLFEKEYNESTIPAERARLAFLAGESLRFMNDHGAAGNWYYLAYKAGFGDQALEAYANALKYQERYQEALKAYEDLLVSNPGNATYRSHVTLARQALEWSQKPANTIVVEPVLFNSSASDYSPYPIGPGQLLFTSDRGSRQSTDTYLWTGRAFSDLFVTNSISNQVAEYDGAINSPANEGTAVISPSGNSIVFTRCYVDNAYDAWCKLMISYRIGNTWSDPEPLPFQHDKSNYGQPAFAANGTTLFFSSDAPEGEGGHDIYFTQLDEGNSWATPVNLGPFINTTGEEQYPTVYKDTLYFSSDHFPGLGGLDIFKTYLDQNSQWVAPVNLRAPINSGGDDFGFVVDTFSQRNEDVFMQGFFTSSREGVSRNDDIYSFEIRRPADADIAVTEPTEITETTRTVNYQVFLALKVMEPVFENKNDPNSAVTGHTALPNGPVILSDGQNEQRLVTDQSGRLLVKLDWDRNYTVSARYRDHLASTITVSTSNRTKNPENPITTINEEIILNPIFRDMEIELENIFYDFNESYIREDAKPSLDYLANIMKSNPGIRIQLASHTDCRGTDEYNLDLSQRRAQAAIEYLISTGINANRLQAQGFGESNLAIRCECESCTEEEHQRNRRTTFKIID